jgi:hypothetical protein
VDLGTVPGVSRFGESLVALGLAGAAALVPAGIAAAQTSPSPTTAAAKTTTVAPCVAPLRLALRFVGTVIANTPTKVRFKVKSVSAGKVPGPQVDVDYSAADDTRFLKVGTTYLVAAAVDPDSSRLVSKVRHPVGEPKVCSNADPIITRDAKGRPVDTAVLAGMRGEWGRVGMAFLIPTAIVLGVLFALVFAKHTILFTGRTTYRLQRWLRSRRSRRARRPPRPGAPQPESRTRTHTEQPVPQ